MNFLDINERKFRLVVAAEVSGIPAPRLAQWVARISDPPTGERRGSRVMFSAVDIATLKIMGELAACGFPPAVAMRTAHKIVSENPLDEIPDIEQAAFGRVSVDENGVGSWREVDKPSGTVAVLTIGRLVQDVLKAAEAVYAPQH